MSFGVITWNENLWKKQKSRRHLFRDCKRCWVCCIESKNVELFNRGHIWRQKKQKTQKVCHKKKT